SGKSNEPHKPTAASHCNKYNSSRKPASNGTTGLACIGLAGAMHSGKRAVCSLTFTQRTDHSFRDRSVKKHPLSHCSKCSAHVIHHAELFCRAKRAHSVLNFRSFLPTPAKVRDWARGSLT